MTAVFADTFFYLAYVNQNDAAHDAAVSFAMQHRGSVVTTSWVITEVFDGLCGQQNRQLAMALWQTICEDPRVVVIPPSKTLLDEGIALYDQRPDKDWSLTDCISFVVMDQHGLEDALTGDHHFTQAGFRVLL